MSRPRYDVIAMGNAIVDVMAPCQDEFIEELGLRRGRMTPVDAARATQLYDAMGPAREISGGSAANTLAALAAMGAQCTFIGQVAADQLGEVFAHDIRAAGVHFSTPPGPGDPPTGRCLILVTPDGQRTMNTYLGASQFLPSAALDLEAVADAAVLYLEAYLWPPEEPRMAMRRAIQAAKAAGRKVAFTLSDVSVIERYRSDFLALIDGGMIDILFANDVELAALTGASDLEAGMAKLATKLPVLVVTRGPAGACAIAGGVRRDIPAEPVEKLVDTTGAGDLFAAGFLLGYLRSETLRTCLTMGAVAAAEIISHYGARPEADLRKLFERRFG